MPKPSLSSAPNSKDIDRITTAARRALQIESDSVAALIDRIDANFANVVHLIETCEGRLIITGIGKSGLIGQKIAATFSSIGVPAMFLHAGEASHGDLGMISDEDIIMAISNSGETEEILKLLPALNRIKATMVALTGNINSTLARRSDYVLDISVKEEACSLNLVPTASTTVTLAMGDALAISLIEKKGFKEEDFAMNHPGGLLGRKLLTTIGDLMHCGEEIPRVRTSSNMLEAIGEMTHKRLGTTTVVDDNDRLVGIITDGDLRRLIETKTDISELKAGDVITGPPKTIGADQLATRAVQVMEEYAITSLVVSEGEGKIDGIIHLHDLLKAGIV